MAFAQGNLIISKEDILTKTTEASILQYYLGIKSIPIIMNSPFREDKKPSFGMYTSDGNKIYFKDFANGESGDSFTLLSKLWGLSFRDTLIKVYNDIPKFSSVACVNKLNINKSVHISSNSELKCKIREWNKEDIEYWNSYGISKDWLVYADVYPISHKIIIRDGKKYTYAADKYAYAYVERKEGKVTLKIYQPFNKKGYKWSNKHDSSVISLWTKVPSQGDKICICSSLKDALCLWANTGIPSIAVQGEGYSISKTAINELKSRYKLIYILFDNDPPGIEDGIKLSNITGFINITLPKYEEYNNPKDISDLYKAINNKEKFKELMLNLFKK